MTIAPVQVHVVDPELDLRADEEHFRGRVRLLLDNRPVSSWKKFRARRLLFADRIVYEATESVTWKNVRLSTNGHEVEVEQYRGVASWTEYFVRGNITLSGIVLEVTFD